MNLQAIAGHRVFKLLKETFDAWMEDNALRLSAQLQGYIGAPAAEAVRGMVKSASKPSDGWLGAGSDSSR